MLARFRARGDVRRRAACAEKARRGGSPCGPFCVLGRSRRRWRPDRRCGAYGPRPASWGEQVPQGGSSLAGLSTSWGIVRWGGLIGAARRRRRLIYLYKAPARFAGLGRGPAGGSPPAGLSVFRGRSLPEDLREDFLLDRSCARHVPEDLRGLPAGLLALTWTSNLTEAVRPALSRRSAVSKRFCIGRPPLWCRRYVPRVSEVRGVYAPSILLCLCCYWLVWSVLRLSLSVLHFLVNVFDS